MSDNRFRVTVYSGGGYSALMAIQNALLAMGIECSVTQGGLRVWGEWSQYEAFAAEIERHEGATFMGGESIHRSGLIQRHKEKTNE